MNILDDAVVDGEQVQTFILEWIVRCHPAFILPVSCLSEGVVTRLAYHNDGLLSLDSRARVELAHMLVPAAWICMALSGIQETMTNAEEFLLDRHRFKLDVDSVWYHTGDGGRDAQDKMSDLMQPVLTYIPVDGVVPDGGLSIIANGLLAILSEVQPAPDPDTMLEDLREASLDGEEQLLSFLSSLALEGERNELRSGEQDPHSMDRSAKEVFQEERPNVGCRLSRLVILLLAFGIPLLLASLPLMVRIGSLPVHQSIQPGTPGYRMLVSAALGLMAAFDTFLLFSKRSPIRLPSGRHPGASAAQRRSLPDILGRLRRDIRISGLVTAVVSRFGTSGRLGAPTSPIAQSDMAERLGFLSEGEPGTPEEINGIRAYVLTTEFLVGRDPDAADLAIPDASVGRVHARITRQEGVFYLTDLGSVNGTRLDGRRLDRHVQVLLPDRCKIGIADREFYFIVD